MNCGGDDGSVDGKLHIPIHVSCSLHYCFFVLDLFTCKGYGVFNQSTIVTWFSVYSSAVHVDFGLLLLPSLVKLLSHNCHWHLTPQLHAPDFRLTKTHSGCVSENLSDCIAASSHIPECKKKLTIDSTLHSNTAYPNWPLYANAFDQPYLQLAL